MSEVYQFDIVEISFGNFFLVIFKDYPKDRTVRNNIGRRDFIRKIDVCPFPGIRRQQQYFVLQDLSTLGIELGAHVYDFFRFVVELQINRPLFIVVVA